MARRIVFMPTAKEEESLFREVLVDFEWVPGMAISQARKSVRNLHDSARRELKLERIIEISTRSSEPLGLSFSAFNLHVEVDDRSVSVESAYQASKVFQLDGPFLDILNASSLDAKRDPRLKVSGPLTKFLFQKEEWPLKLAPNFYDFLFISGLLGHKDRHLLLEYQAFTDIAFSQTSLDYKLKRSYNCQARSIAIYISLMSRYKESQLLDALKIYSLNPPETSGQLDLF